MEEEAYKVWLILELGKAKSLFPFFPLIQKKKFNLNWVRHTTYCTGHKNSSNSFYDFIGILIVFPHYYLLL